MLKRCHTYRPLSQSQDAIKIPQISQSITRIQQLKQESLVETVIQTVNERQDT